MAARRHQTTPPCSAIFRATGRHKATLFRAAGRDKASGVRFTGNGQCKTAWVHKVTYKEREMRISISLSLYVMTIGCYSSAGFMFV